MFIVMSNDGDWDLENIGFIDVLPEININDFIKKRRDLDDSPVSFITLDINGLTEYLNSNEMTIWQEANLKFVTAVVFIDTDTDDELLYIVYQNKGINYVDLITLTNDMIAMLTTDSVLVCDNDGTRYSFIEKSTNELFVVDFNGDDYSIEILDALQNYSLEVDKLN